MMETRWAKPGVQAIIRSTITLTTRRQDIPEYPEIALREVLFNAIAHADYSLTGMRIRVAIYADRLEVENPGMLPFGMTPDNFKAGVSRIRNRVIVRAMRELGLLEEWGIGLVGPPKTGSYRLAGQS